MATVERSTVVATTPDNVWAVLSDFAAISRWAPNVDHSCAMSEQVGDVGAVRRIQIEGATVVETVEKWSPGSTLSYRITGLPPVIKSVTNTWQLAAEGEKTHISLITDVDAGSRPPQLLIAKAVGKRLASASEEMLDGLTRHLVAMASSPNVATTTSPSTTPIGSTS